VAGTSAPISLAPSPCVGVRLHACVGVACGRRPCVCMRPAVRACMACGLCCVCACVHAFACGVVCVHACLSCMRGCVCACDYACVCMHARRASAPQITAPSYVPCHLYVSRLLSCLPLQLWTSMPRILAPRRAISAPWFTASSLGSIFRNLSKRGIFVRFFPQKGQKAKKKKSPPRR
jgi:hypothetical protein